MNNWNKKAIRPDRRASYAKRYVRVLADDEGGFVREAFYDPKEDYYFALGINRRGEFHEIPLIVTRWCYLPKTEN